MPGRPQRTTTTTLPGEGGATVDNGRPQGEVWPQTRAAEDRGGEVAVPVLTGWPTVA